VSDINRGPTCVLGVKRYERLQYGDQRNPREYILKFRFRLIPVAAWSTAWVCGYPLAGIVVSISAGDMDGSLLQMLCIVR